MRRTLPTRIILVTITLLAWWITACSPTIGCGVRRNKRVHSDLLLQIGVNGCDIRAGDKVHITFTVTNQGSSQKVVETQGLPVLDIQVAVDERRTKVLAAWSEEHPDLVVNRLVWLPGESKAIEMDWTAEYVNFYGIPMIGMLNEGLNTAEFVDVGICVMCDNPNPEY